MAITVGTISADTVDTLPPVTRSVTLASPNDGLIVTVATGTAATPFPLDSTVTCTFDPGGANQVIKSAQSGLVVGTGHLGDTGSVSSAQASLVYLFTKAELPSSGTYDVTFNCNNTTDGTMMACFPVSNGGTAIQARQTAIGFTNGVSANNVTATFGANTASGNLVIAVGCNGATSSMNITPLSNSVIDYASSILAGNTFNTSYQINPTAYSTTTLATDNAANTARIALAVAEFEPAPAAFKSYFTGNANNLI